MKRTKNKIASKFKRLPDAIRLSPGIEFTQIRNSILRDDRISYKAKGLLCLLLSNKSGEWVSYLETLKKYSTDGKDSIRTGIKELEVAGYLMKIFYVDKVTKRRQGSFWAYTDIPQHFEINTHLKWLDENNLEIQGGSLKPKIISRSDPEMENPDMENPDMENPLLKILNYKNTNNNIFIPKNKTNDKNDKYIPLAKLLGEIIQKNKNIKLSPNKINSWANDIRKLEEIDGVEYSRIKQALKWYSTHIGGKYIPVIESGHSLREKFIKLEDAIKRELPETPSNGNNQPILLQSSPNKIIHNYFKSKDLSKFFYKNCYKPALSLFNENVDKIYLTNRLIELHSQIEERQKKIPKNIVRLLPGPIDLISNYITWIKDNDWIKHKNLNMFHIIHSLFDEFCISEASKDNLTRDPLTGKSLHKEG